ncbi:MAG: sugar kinase [Rhizobiaceae bacterium]|nr:sugar kinase [Rhizobiaceae bacterium]
MASVLVAGVAVIDFVFRVDEMPRRAEKYRATDADIVGGGGAANAAVTVARLGGRAVLATRLGDDAIADMILADLGREGVDCSLARRFPGKRSSFSSVFVDRQGERQIVNYRDMGISFDADWISGLLPDRFDAALADTRWPQGGPAVLNAARARGKPAVVDAEAPIGEAMATIRAGTHIAFSRQGLRDFAGHDDMRAALGQATEATGAWVCVTDGSADVVFHAGGAFGTVPAFPVEAVDTLAAGDVWHGAFALFLAEGMGETDAIRLANAVAAIKCTRFGGRAGVPGRAEAEAFLRERSAAA